MSALHGLYLITNDDPWSVLEAKLHAALAQGVALLQYRRKQTPKADQPAEAAQILAICRHYGVPLIINDDVVLAAQLGCGVHLGQSDGSLLAARQQLGAQAIIGRTCHGSLELARQAVREGASYVAFGAVCPSATKPHASRVELSVLRQAKAEFDVPVCVIGGLTVENIDPVVACGVDVYAVVGDVLGLPAEEIITRIEMWQEAFLPLRAYWLKQSIIHAFAGITLGDGYGLREADAYDDYMVTAQTLQACRGLDEKDDWRKILVEDLQRYSFAVAAFNPEGMRFHLPAYLLAVIDGQYDGISFYLTQANLDRFSALNHQQKEVVVQFLQWWVEQPDGQLHRTEVIDCLLSGVWSQM